MKRVVVAVSGLLLLPVSAGAETITANSLRVGNASAVNVVKNGVSRSVWAGEWIWNGFDPAPDGFGGDFNAYYVDLTKALDDAQAFEIEEATSMPANRAQVAWLASTYAPMSHHTPPGAAPPTSRAIWLDTDRGQDQVTVSVPEPAVLLLLGIGLAGVSAARRRFSAS